MSRRDPQKRHEPRLDLPTKNEIGAWVKNGFQNETIDFAEEFGNYLVKNRLTTSQIRNIFSEVKRVAGEVAKVGKVEGKNKQDFLMLRPKMAYAAQRAGGRGIEDLKKVLDNAHIAVSEVLDEPEKGKEAFGNFVDFFEAILAYHKAAGGRD